jgi:hypothetical protein
VCLVRVVTGRLTVAHGNVYAANQTPGRARLALERWGPDSMGLNEANNFRHHLSRLTRHGHYRATVAPAGGRAQETPTLVRDTLRPLGEVAVLVSEAVPLDDKWAPDRWVTAAMFQHPTTGPTAHLTVHLNAVVHGLPETVPRVREYARSVEAIDGLLTWLAREGFDLVVTGDVNHPAAGPQPSWSVHRVLQAHGLRVWAVGPDLIAWPKRLHLARRRVAPRRRTGSDHPFLCVDLEAR